MRRLVLSMGQAAPPPAATPSPAGNINTTTVGERVFHWVLFGVLAALLPFVFGLLGEIQHTGQEDTDVAELISSGELYIATAGIAAAAIGTLAGKTGQRRLERLVALGTSVLLLAITSYLFADTKLSSVDPDRVKSQSLFWFVLTVIVGTVAAWVSED